MHSINKMKILFLTTAHNSLSQRLYLSLSSQYNISIEYALSDQLMIESTELFKPDLIICPFLTTRVPKEIYNNYLTLIIHPGPPGDSGPSALDWLLLGDDGKEKDSKKVLETVNNELDISPGRTHWGVTVLQAIEKFDAGPIWAFEQFPVDIDQYGLTKSELYRGPVTKCAISACVAAINRIKELSNGSVISANLLPLENYGKLSVKDQMEFQGGKTWERPLLKANQRDFDAKRHTSKQISRKIRCGDSQPGSLSMIFGMKLYIYGGIVEDSPESIDGPNFGYLSSSELGTIVATRNEAVCIRTIDNKGIWITHVRKPKSAQDKSLWPKVPAVSGLIEYGVLQVEDVSRLEWQLPIDWSKVPGSTFQEVFVDFESYGPKHKNVAYVYFNFYNGAMSSSQCQHLIEAFEYILDYHDNKNSISTVVLMGGSYFSNGIALNVIESAKNQSQESWKNINLIDDVVFYLLSKFPSKSILTVSALRGNAAAGGVALATSCDIVLSGTNVVLNPSYRGIGLYGSEYHTLSYYGRCGERKAKEICDSMLPLSPFEARSIGLIDHIIPGNDLLLDKRIRNHINVIARSGSIGRVKNWKKQVDVSLNGLSSARLHELGQMSLDFWSARSMRYQERRFSFVRKVKPTKTPLRFAKHRRITPRDIDEEEKEEFLDVEYFERLHKEQIIQELMEKLKQTSSEGLGSPFLKVSNSGETLFSCYYNSESNSISGNMSTTSRKSSDNGLDIHL